MNLALAMIAAAAIVDDLDLRIDEEEEESAEDEGAEEAEEAPKTKKKKGSKKVKKGSKLEKKSSKSEKSEKSAKSDLKGDIVRLKDLAKQAKITEAVARKKLRDAEVPRGEGRWSWALGSRDLKAARKALGLGQ